MRQKMSQENINEKILLNTCKNINQELSGEIQKIEIGYAQVELATKYEMLADERELIHAGFVFSAAHYAAMAAINEKKAVLVVSECQFLSPAKLGDKIRVDARVHNNGHYKNVQVEAFVLDIKIFTGHFKSTQGKDFSDD